MTNDHHNHHNHHAVRERGTGRAEYRSRGVLSIYFSNGDYGDAGDLPLFVCLTDHQTITKREELGDLRYFHIDAVGGVEKIWLRAIDSSGLINLDGRESYMKNVR